MTNESLTQERNIFLAGFVATTVLSWIFQLNAAQVGQAESLGPTFVLIAKGAFIYLVFRLSRFLNQPVWLTALYCVLAPFAVLYLIPLVGLLRAVGETRKSIVAKRVEHSHA